MMILLKKHVIGSGGPPHKQKPKSVVGPTT